MERVDRVNTNKRVRDLIRYGSSEECVRSIVRCQTGFTVCCDWVAKSLERNDRNLAFFNILGQTVPFLRFAAWGIDKPIQVLAFSARSVFELNLRGRHMLRSDENLRQWMSEGVIDSIQVLEGVLELRESASAGDVALLEAEIERLRSLAGRHELAHRGKLLQVGELARSVGLESDYKAFFKLYSKLVHPSSYLVNGAATAWDRVLRQVLVVNLQLYAYDLLERVRTGLGVPDVVVYSPVDGPSERLTSE